MNEAFKIIGGFFVLVAILSFGAVIAGTAFTLGWPEHGSWDFVRHAMATCGVCVGIAVPICMLTE